MEPMDYSTFMDKYEEENPEATITMGKAAYKAYQEQQGKQAMNTRLLGG